MHVNCTIKTKYCPPERLFADPLCSPIQLDTISHTCTTTTHIKPIISSSNTIATTTHYRLRHQPATQHNALHMVLCKGDRTSTHYIKIKIFWLLRLALVHANKVKRWWHFGAPFRATPGGRCTKSRKKNLFFATFQWLQHFGGWKIAIFQHLLVSIWAYSGSFVVLGAVVIGTVVKWTIPSTHWPTASLIHKVPIEAHEWSMLIAFVLQKRWALFHSEFFQVSATKSALVVYRRTRRNLRYKLKHNLTAKTATYV